MDFHYIMVGWKDSATDSQFLYGALECPFDLFIILKADHSETTRFTQPLYFTKL